MKEYQNKITKNSLCGGNDLNDLTDLKELRDPGNLLLLIYVTVMVCILILGVLWEGAAAMTGTETGVRPDDVQRGELLVAMENGQLHPAPLLSQKVDITVSGITARVKVEQSFVNNDVDWINAVYVFPLPDESSVDHLRLRVGERLLEGRIMEKEEAQKTHEMAKVEGKKSSLLVQNRPNIFTTEVANIGPEEEVTVLIEYQQTVHFADNVFSLRFPMVVAPRYIPGQPLVGSAESDELADSRGATESPESSEATESVDQPMRVTATGWAVDTDQVPDASQITPPVDLDGKTIIPVKLTIDLAAGIPLSRLESLYHGVESEQIGEAHYSIWLTNEIKADRDFVLEWQPEDAGDAKAALFAETLGDNQYMLLMLMPPQKMTASPAPREVIFILDISGSMAGTSIIQAKAAIDLALSRLRPADHFNVIVFNNDPHALFSTAKPADQSHIQKARHYIDQIRAEGGTEMKSALMLALEGSHQHERLRQVVFLTDGAVGNEDELLKVIGRRLGDSRLFTVGIGSAPNSYFMNRAATIGRGTFTYIGKYSEVTEKMMNLFTKLESPVLSDLKLELAGSELDIEGYPSPLPDLYMGEPLVLAVRTGWENVILRLTGMSLGQPWETMVDTSTYGKREGIGALWARKKIRSQMESLALGANEEIVRDEVLKTALEHHLVSKYTSLVAVDTVVSKPGQSENETGIAEDAEIQVAVKTHLPHGWQAAAVFGGGSQTATPATLRMLIGVCLLAMACALLSIGRRRKWRVRAN